MAYYQINRAVKLREGHTALVVPPLLAALLFCFLMVLVHSPSKPLGEAAATARQSPSQHAPKQSALPALDDANQAPLPAIEDTIVTVEPNASAGTSTGTPQPTNNHSSSDLQSANSNQGNNKKITVPRVSMYQRLINKLN